MTSRKNNGQLEKLHDALLTLLRLGLWEQTADCQALPRLSMQEWGAVYRLARQHTVTGLAFQGLSMLRESQLPPQDILVQWLAEADAVERRNRQMNDVLEQLYGVFRDHGLTPILQKGQGVAMYYERPLLRMCGDIDLYFPNRESWHAALSLLRQRHVRLTRQADKSIYYQYHGICVEHHRRLFDLYHPCLQGFLGKLESRKGYRHIALSKDSEVRVAVPSPFLDLLLQNLHILKHAVSQGIGLRQLCDLARTCYRVHGEIDPEEMRRVCRELGLERWCPLLHAFLTGYLGLPVECLPYHSIAPTAAPLAHIVWEGGNFGQHVRTDIRREKGGRRKWNTFCAFLRHLRFAACYAPKETFWYFIQLLKGQF